jgi:octaprenyl-diphosphate synthase
LKNNAKTANIVQKIPIFAAVKKLSDIIRPFATELAQFEAFFDQTLKAETEPMDNIMGYVRDTMGKRIRPILVLLSTKLFGEINEQTLRSATFVEMIHSATLIHDDVVDDANQRRNKASVKAQFGNLSAVLSGDYLLAKAMLLLANPDDHAILQEMLSTTAAMSEGELMQTIVTDCVSQSENTPSQQDRYLEIITRKTAMLMRSCCTAGALSVNATSEQVKQIADFGLNFGILFQLRDDILDGENIEQATILLPVYLQKTLKSLKGFPASETLDTLHDLTVFCAEREE